VVAAGAQPDFGVIALDATTGGELWRYTVDGTAIGDADQDDAFAVAVDAAGDVLAVGRLSHSANDDDLIAVKLAGATGAELWRTIVDGPNHNADVAQDLALAPNGDLLVTGTLRRPVSRADFLIARLANASGAEQWRTLINGSESEGDQGLAIAPIGADVVAAGRLRNGTTGDGFVVTRRSGSNGGDFPCGNAAPDPGEACDDGNAIVGDGCRLDCTAEVCGDGIVDPQDACDDGNVASGDCCSETCAIESGPCDDGNACTLGDACQDGVCTPASTTTCTPETPCHIATCDSATGTCLSTLKAEGALCDDGNACTSLDRCFATLCNGTTATVCSDDDPCTVDGCDPTTSCTFTPYTSFPSVICLFERGRIGTACGSDLPRSVARRMELARRLLDKASAGDRPGSVRRSLRRAAKALEKARRLTEKQRRRDRIGAGCADVLDAELAIMASRTRAIGAELAAQ
jgi:cysteine-rich repeat protein